MPAQKLHSDSIAGLKSLGRGVRLPSPGKFQSGYLASRLGPVSRGAHMETGSDSDDEVYDVHYSVVSSPQDDKIANRVGPRYTNSANRHTVDILSREANGAYKASWPGFWDNSTSDSVTSSGVSPAIHSSNKGIARQGNRGRGMQTKNNLDDDIPSAPPFAGSTEHFNEGRNQRMTSRADSYSFHETSRGSTYTDEPNRTKRTSVGVNEQDYITKKTSDQSVRNASVSSSSLPSRFPKFHASGLGLWYAVISYDACVRLCLHSWAKGCMEAPMFLENECALLRNAFGVKQILLQSEEELLKKKSSELVSEKAALRPKKTFGKMKVQVRKVKMALDPPTGCSFSSFKLSVTKLDSFRFRLSRMKSALYSEWTGLQKVHLASHIPPNGSFSRQGLVYLHVGIRYMKRVPQVLKVGLATLRKSSSPCKVVNEETYNCLLRLKSSSEEDAVRMQPGSSETHIFLPDGLGDNLIIEVHDSMGMYCGHVLAQVADIADDPGDKLRWWSIFHEPEHELVGRIQLYINYSTNFEENTQQKCGSVAETVAYDLVLEAAMKIQQFQQRNLLLHGSWRWLVCKFASYYGVSDAYTKLRYLSYVMDVATPTADCLDLVYDFLYPVTMKGNTKSSLSHQENRILGEISEQIEHIIALVFENYKSLDESLPSGMVDVFRPATGSAAPALAPALKVYSILHDVLSCEAQLKLCRYFQIAAKKQSRRHLSETDDFVSSNNETLMASAAFSTGYQKMKSLCFNFRNEIFTDIEIDNQHVLPSFVDLPNLSSSIYSVELCNRLRSFLLSCPPTGPSPPVAELVIATADFQRDLDCWKINPIKGGVDAKELFHSYITRWIQDKRLALLEECKLDKVKWSGVKTSHFTTPFIDEMYDLLKETLNDYEVIICRWPEYTFHLEHAVADIEKAIMDTLDKQYADVLSPLKENAIQLGFKYVQRITKTTACTYTVPDELGILMNSIKRMLDVLRPRIELQLKSWASCIPDGGNAALGEHLSEITVMLRAKFRNYMQAVVEKLVENTRLQSSTKLKKIIQDAKESGAESDFRSRMQPLRDLLTRTITHLHTVFETQVFIIICRGFWDRMGQELLRFLVDRKENQFWYKGSRVAVSIMDDTFASEMQKLLGNAIQEKDLESPRSIMEVRSMLCKDSVNDKDNNYYF